VAFFVSFRLVAAIKEGRRRVEGGKRKRERTRKEERERERESAKRQCAAGQKGDLAADNAQAREHKSRLVRHTRGVGWEGAARVGGRRRRGCEGGEADERMGGRRGMEDEGEGGREDER